ncbi:MAG: YtxH domain-containing protein [Bacteroidetes bacterium]|nr:YtxH domain-containing protein [Bacteroidota bacterium]HET6244314.1 YtxH domain-containing protein [Bacteroidia bacterium]
MRTFWTFFTGVAAGTIIAILYAPDRGTETRRKIASKTRRLTDEFTGNVESTMDEMAESGERAYRKANEMVERTTGRR